ncbi:MAG: hypothetical protein MJY96_08205 [Bacteroidaceae bacterium]|nr:hypothetical protein [Bacteroidaceae bacterium]
MTEIEYLKQLIAQTYGAPIETSSDFERLSNTIEEALKQPVSISTLKRLWGYVSMAPKPRMSTLDILCRFVGRKDYRHLCIELKQSSSLFSADKVFASELETGTKILLGWQPDRLVTLVYLGQFKFAVIESVHSKLHEGDVLEFTSVLLGHPLYVGKVERAGQDLQSYVAGRAGGISKIEIVKPEITSK